MGSGATGSDTEDGSGRVEKDVDEAQIYEYNSITYDDHGEDERD